MADELNTIVQRMIDAGESEENIATVIQHFQQPYQADPNITAATKRAIARQSGLLPIVTSPASDTPPNPIAKSLVQNPLIQGAAHPTTLGDLSSLLIPDAPGAFRGAIQGAKDTANYLSRVHVHPSALFKIKATQPFEFLKDAISVDPPPAPVPPAFGGAWMPPSGPPRPAEVPDLPLQDPRTPPVATQRDLAKAGVAHPDRYVEAAPGKLVPITSERRMGELMNKFGGTQPAPDLTPIPNIAETPLSQPLGTPKILTRKATPTTWTPEAARARIEFNDWHTGAEPGTPEAMRAAARHAEHSALDARFKYLLDDPKAAYLLPAVLGGGIGARQLLLDGLQPVASH